MNLGSKPRQGCFLSEAGYTCMLKPETVQEPLSYCPVLYWCLLHQEHKTGKRMKRAGEEKGGQQEGWKCERSSAPVPLETDTNQGVHGRETTLQNREWTWEILSLASDHTRKTERDDQLYSWASNMGKARGHAYHKEATQEAPDLWWKRGWADTNENLPSQFK